MDKKLLRQQMIAQLEALIGTKNKRQQVEQISEALFASSEWQQAQTIGVTISTALEFPTALIMRLAVAQGKKIAVPKSLPQRKLEFHWVDAATEYETTPFGVDEPLVEAVADKNELDLLIVPGLLYRPNGYRIGFGGGFYDRYLADYAGQTVSLVFAEQLHDHWEVEPFDIPIQKLFVGTVTDN